MHRRPWPVRSPPPVRFNFLLTGILLTSYSTVFLLPCLKNLSTVPYNMECISDFLSVATLGLLPDNNF